MTVATRPEVVVSGGGLGLYSPAECLACRRPAWICGEARVRRTDEWFSGVRREYLKGQLTAPRVTGER